MGRWVKEVRGWEDAWSSWEEEVVGRWVEEVRGGKWNMCGGVGKR